MYDVDVKCFRLFSTGSLQKCKVDFERILAEN